MLLSLNLQHRAQPEQHSLDTLELQCSRRKVCLPILGYFLCSFYPIIPSLVKSDPSSGFGCFGIARGIGTRRSLNFEKVAKFRYSVLDYLNILAVQTCEFYIGHTTSNRLLDPVASMVTQQCSEGSEYGGLQGLYFAQLLFLICRENLDNKGITNDVVRFADLVLERI